MTFFKWSRTASANATADSTCPFPEGMAPSAVNDGVRGLMAAAAKYRDDMAGAILTSGSSTAYTVASFEGFDNLTHLDGTRLAFTPHTGNGATVTLNVDGLGAKPLRGAPGVELSAAVLVAGTPYVATYFNATGEFILNGFFNLPNVVPIGAFMAFSSTTVPNSNFILPFGQALSRSTYAAYFAMVSTTFGSGDGTTTFNAPDLRGRVIAGLDNMGGTTAGKLTTALGGIDGVTIGATGGTQSKTASELPSHDHDVFLNDPGHAHSTSGGAQVGTTFVSVNLGGLANVVANPTSFSINTAVTGITVRSAAGGGGNSNKTALTGSSTPFGIAQPSMILPIILRVI
jgi:microcystin-dependent protein